MSERTEIFIGNVAAIFVGDADTNDVLQQVNVPLTQGSIFSFAVPQTFQPADNRARQSAFFTLQFSLTFFPSPEAERLANGHQLSATNHYDPSTMAHYAILLLAETNESPETIYIPRCFTNVAYTKNKQKTDYERVPVVFNWTGRNRFALPLPYYENSADYLKTNEIIPPDRCPAF